MLLLSLSPHGTLEAPPDSGVAVDALLLHAQHHNRLLESPERNQGVCSKGSGVRGRCCSIDEKLPQALAFSRAQRGGCRTPGAPRGAGQDFHTLGVKDAWLP